MNKPPVTGYVDTRLVIELTASSEEPFLEEGQYELHHTVNEYFGPLQSIMLSRNENKAVFELVIEMEFPFSAVVPFVDEGEIIYALREDEMLITRWEEHIHNQLDRVPHHSIDLNVKIEELLSMKLVSIDMSCFGL